MRKHGTNARYRLGPTEDDEPGGCRCAACREAGRNYDRAYRERAVPVLVDARRARRHVRELMAARIGPKTIAQRSGVSHGAISKLIYGAYSGGKRTPSRRIKKATEDALLAVHSGWSAEDGTMVPAGPVHEIVAELVARGWSKVAIARAIGQTGPSLQLGRDFVTRRHAAAIKALLDEPVQTKRRRDGSPSKATWEPTVVDRVVGPTPTIVEFGGEAWRDKAECKRRNVPTWAFYPALSDKRMITAALKVCEACPVRRECRDASDGYGVWGGEYMEAPVDEEVAS